MKLSGIAEGIVSTSRSRIVSVKNDIADAMVRMIQRLGLPEPDVEYADSGSEDAILYLSISGSILMVNIIADDDIQIQLPEPLARALQIPSYIKLGDPSRVRSILSKMRKL